MNDHYGVYHPDTLDTWRQYLAKNDCEQHIWNEDEKKWETDNEYEYDSKEDEDMDEEFDDIQERAENSIKLHKRPFDKVEREIRKDNPEVPLWMSRFWFYLTMFDDTRKAQILKIENDLKKQAQTKKRKSDCKKLFKRLKMKHRKY
tara:strand:- start:55 stop:492 length:438 start_codon:yes stop_codon:yes gene_type:complete